MIPESRVAQNNDSTEQSLLNETDTTPTNIEDLEPIITTDSFNSTNSSLLETPKVVSTKSGAIYLWITVAVIYVILVVISLIWY